MVINRQFLNSKKSPMRRTTQKIILAAAFSILTLATKAQTNVWHDDFDQFPIGANSDDASYGAVAYNFTSAGFGAPRVVITNNHPDTIANDPSYTHSNNCAFIFNTDPNVWANVLNFGLRMNRVPVVGGNTNTALRDYTLNFDVAVQNVSITDIGGFVSAGIGVYGNNSGEYSGDGCETNIPLSMYPAAGSGYVHYSVNLGTFNTAHGTLLNPTDGTLSFFINFYMAGHTHAGDVEIDFANVSITMSNPPPPPPPTLTIIPAKPGLRIFSQDTTATYNQEGFSTVDVNQSWIGRATPSAPVSYSLNIRDFDTINGYTLYAQFVQNGASGDPYGVYFGQNALVWQITHQDAGFTTRVDWKTNSPANGQNNSALATTVTTSTNGHGTWTLKFTSDTDGAVIAPDGTSTAFTLPVDPTWSADFANPMVLDIGTAPNNSPGYGQFIDLKSIAISNVVNGSVFDDFTADTSFNTSLWNQAFSYNAASANNFGSVYQVSSNAAYWITWTQPAEGFTLAASGSVTNANTWSTPDYYGAAVGATITKPQVQGGIHTWTLVPAATFPTIDGFLGSAVSPTGFYRLQNPPPAQ